MIRLEAPAHTRVAAALCFLVAWLEGYDIQAFGVAAPMLARDLALSPSAVGMAGAAAMAGMVAGASAGGVLSARIGAKPVLIGATAAFALFSLLTSLVSTPATLITCRLFMGAGIGAAMPNLLAIAMRLRPGGSHAGLTTAIFCGMPVGGASVALVAAALGQPLPWRTLVAIGGIVPLLLTPALMLALPRFAPTARRQEGGLLNALFGGGRAISTAALWLAFIAALLLLYLLLNWLPLLTLAQGYSAEVATRAALAFNIGGVVAALVAGRWADRAGFVTPIVASAALLAIGLITVATLHQSAALLGGAVLLGAGAVAGQYLLYAAAPVAYPPACAVAAAGVAIGMGRFGSIAGPLFAGFAGQSGVSVSHMLLALLPVVAVIALATPVALRRGDRSALTLSTPDAPQPL